jgi:hypothetical protein
MGSSMEWAQFHPTEPVLHIVYSHHYSVPNRWFTSLQRSQQFIHIITAFPTIDYTSLQCSALSIHIAIETDRTKTCTDRWPPRKNPKTFRWINVVASWLQVGTSFSLSQGWVWFNLGNFFQKPFFFFVDSAQKEKRFFICPWFWIPFFIKTSVGLCCWLKCELCYSSNFSFQMIIKV